MPIFKTGHSTTKLSRRISDRLEYLVMCFIAFDLITLCQLTAADAQYSWYVPYYSRIKSQFSIILETIGF